MKQLFLLCWLFLCAIPAMAQNKKAPYKKRWQLATSIGINMASKNIAKGSGTDALITYEPTTMAWQGLRAEYYFLKRFGVYGQVRGNGISTPSTAKRQDIYDFFHSDLGNQYYLLRTPGADAEMNAVYSNRTGSTKGALGILYRWENQRFQVSAGLGLSFHETAVFTDSFYLKEKDANAYFKVKYSKTALRGGILGILSADLAAAYKLRHWLWIKADAAWSADRYHFSIDRTITNINTQATTSRSSIYKGNLSNGYLGLGLALAF